MNRFEMAIKKEPPKPKPKANKPKKKQGEKVDWKDLEKVNRDAPSEEWLATYMAITDQEEKLVHKKSSGFGISVVDEEEYNEDEMGQPIYIRPKGRIQEIITQRAAVVLPNKRTKPKAEIMAPTRKLFL